MGNKKKSITTVNSTKTKPIAKLDRTKSSETNTRGIFSFIAEDGKKYKLTLKEKMFCEYYLTFNGNGTDAIIEAGYDVSFSNGSGINRKLAHSMSGENLVKPKIYYYINSLLSAEGFNKHNVTKQHVFLLNQQADLSAKKGAVDMFYKLRGDYAPEKFDVRGILSEFDDLPNDKLTKASTLRKKK